MSQPVARLKSQALRLGKSRRTHWTVGVIVTTLLLIAFALPPLLRSQAQDILTEKLGRPVAIEAIQINPLALSISIQGLSIGEHGSTEHLFSFREFYLNLEAISLIKGGPVLRDIRLDQPVIRVARLGDNQFSFSDILQRLNANKTDAPAPPASEPARFSLNNIRINNGEIHFDDRPLATQHAIRQINISVPFLSNLPYQVEEYITPAFSASINGTTLALAGRTKPFSDSRRTEFELDLKALDIPHYMAYLPAKFHFTIPKGSADTQTKLSFVQYPNTDRAPEVLLAATMDLRDLAVIDEQQRPLFQLTRAQATLTEGNIIGKRFQLGRIVVDDPSVFVRRDTNGVLNLTRLVDPEPEEEESTTIVEIDELQLNRGLVDFQDHATRPAFSTQLQGIQATLRQFSTAPDKQATLALELATREGAKLAHQGQFTLKPSIKANGNLTLSDLALPQLAPYFPANLKFDITEGRLGVATDYRFAQGGETVIDNLSATLKALSLRQQGQRKPFLTLPQLGISQTAVELNHQRLTIGKLDSQGARLAVQRNAKGEINLSQLIAPSPPTPASAPASPAWVVNLNRVDITNYAVQWHDQLPAQSASLNLSAIALHASGLSTAPKTQGKASLALTVNNKGKLQANGPLSISPFAGNLALNLKGLDLMPVQPYFTDKLNIVVSSGALNAQGRLQLSTEPSLRLSYRGDTGLTQLATQDKATLSPLLNWNSLYISGVDFQLDPMRLDIQEVALSDFYSRINIDDHGRINLQDIVVKPAVEANSAVAATPAVAPAPTATTAASAEPTAPPINIARVTLQGGTIDFSDHFIQPNYAANLTEMTGRVSGLSSNADILADLDLRGKLEGRAPLLINGKINPLGKELYANVNAQVKGFDLSPLTPYSGKFAGYTIEKGKLSLDLNYLIEHGKLNAQNKVFLDQFNFGDKVESPDAVNLPVNLAVALLKNRAGEIDLKLPVEGTLSDPEFRIGQVVWQVVKNLIVKIVTSPFALLGSLVGGGEELSYVVFDPGSHALTDTAQGKLASLEKALYDRPALRLEIVGHVDPEQDTLGLRQQEFMLKLKRQKFNELMGTSQAKSSLDDIVIVPEEYARYLKLAYKAEKFPKPRTAIGTLKDLPDEEMEKLINSYIQINNEDLRTLAISRATMVMSALLTSGKVEAERVFLVEPKDLAPEQKNGVKNSRVDFTIK